MRKTYSATASGSATIAKWSKVPPGWSGRQAIDDPEACMTLAAWPGLGTPLIRGIQRLRNRDEDEVWAVGIVRLPSPGMDRAVYRDATHTHAPCVLMIPLALAKLLHESGDTLAAWQDRLIDCGVMAPAGKKSLRIGDRAVAMREVPLPGINDGPASWFVLRGELGLLSLAELRRLPPALAALAHIFRPVFDPYFQRHAPRQVHVPEDWPDHPFLHAPHGLGTLKPPMPRRAEDERAHAVRRVAKIGSGEQVALL